MSLLSKEHVQHWQNGNCFNAYEVLGAHKTAQGIQFGVWAPNAKAVHIMGDFNDWDHQAHLMTKDDATGIWQAAVGDAKPGHHYKFSITPQEGTPVLKADPYGFYHESGSHHASVICPLPEYEWSDEQWMSRRQEVHQPDKPLSIYEVHLGSWKRKPSGEHLSYLELADELIPYVKKMGFTHIELMPVMEHPYNPSWGYQITGYYAPTARYGRPEDFMAFVDACHGAGIGVILDWVPGHFPKDDHGLAYFDGTPLYEHADPRRREHADWGTHNFDFEKTGVRNFLFSNAFFWFEEYHIDGFRVDAVASMLYLDYSKGDGQWLPNTYGGKQNLGAIAFIQDLNELLHRHHPDVLTIAEESTEWAGVTGKVDEGGLGFDYKWNMGWMNDTLHYFEQPPGQRPAESHAITFPATFAFTEQFILPFSHDEVVHLKQSLWSKMPGPLPQKFRQLKLLYLYMMGYPGKKLLFMGSELAEKQEWSQNRGLHWSLLESRQHKSLQLFLADLLQFYKSEPVLHASDHSPDGFKWKDIEANYKGVFSFSRMAPKGDTLTFLFNFTAKTISNYPLENLDINLGTVLVDSTGDGGSNTDREQISEYIPLKPFQGLILHTEQHQQDQ